MTEKKCHICDREFCDEIVQLAQDARYCVTCAVEACEAFEEIENELRATATTN